MDPDSSHVPCSVKDISDITSDDEHQHLYKDVMKAWMTANATGRSNIRHKLHESIDPLDASTHSDGNVVQIVSSRIATGPTVSVHDAVVIGTEMTKRCESTWPGGFHDTLSKKVRTMTMTKKHIMWDQKSVRRQFIHASLACKLPVGHEPQRGFDVHVCKCPYFHAHQQWRDAINEK